MTPKIPPKLAEYLNDVCMCADKKPQRVLRGSLWLLVCASCGKPTREK